ncbi:MAG: DNA-3-methyladenine glycosylase [Synergistaceae bacterium]|jgi:DNA-3-methyladenine glycosylase|nr:DNA-3-methyladenine glycosylase [Synergistaceae bacterium]
MKRDNAARKRVFEREFYLDGAVAVARKLLGAVLICDSPEGATCGRIVETEAYAGRSDEACHSYGRTASSGHRTDVMFGPGGFAYIYLIYGMYNCFNVVANAIGEPEAVLIRAIEPTDGIRLMESRRNTTDPLKLCGGPGKLCIAMGITRAMNGTDVCGGGRISIAKGDDINDDAVSVTPRINVDYSGEAKSYQYRFVLRDSAFLSTRRFLTARARRANLP